MEEQPLKHHQTEEGYLGEMLEMNESAGRANRLRIGMYRIVILLDNQIPDILLIEPKQDTGYPANCLTRYPAR